MIKIFQEIIGTTRTYRNYFPSSLRYFLVIDLTLGLEKMLKDGTVRCWDKLDSLDFFKKFYRVFPVVLVDWWLLHMVVDHGLGCGVVLLGSGGTGGNHKGCAQST